MNNGTNTLWYKQGAASWNEALPLGNGRIGAMVYGGAEHELIALNEDTLWSGYPKDKPNPEGPESLKHIQELIMEGKPSECQEEIEKRFLGYRSQMYMPLGDLSISMNHLTPVADYKRTLDLETGLHTVSYTADGTSFVRETFVSNPDQVMAVVFTAKKENAINFSFGLLPALKAEVDLGDDYCEFVGNAPTYFRAFQSEGNSLSYGKDDAEKGIGYCARACVITDGKVKRSSGRIFVTGANQATVLFAVRTNFNGWNKHPVLEGKPYVEPCLEDLKNAAQKDVKELKKAHIADFSALYNRVELELGGGDERQLPTDERLYRHENGEPDPALYALYFNYGRYLTIASSREGTQATNLQGIWNDMVNPAWCSGYTTNINTEMNYWPVLPCNLAECHEPLVSFTMNLTEAGRKTAKEWFGKPGTCASHNVDIWCMSEPANGAARWSYWPMCIGWLSRHLFEQYEFTLNLDFLREKAWSVLKPAAEFFQSMLLTDSDGTLVMAPGTSSENGYYLSNGKRCEVSKYTAMFQYIVRETFENTIKTCRLLGIEQEFADELETLTAKLKMPQIGKDGRLQEFDGDYEEPEIHHRHISHLYGLYPARYVTVDDTPELAEAVKKSLLVRGDETSGWAMGWRVCEWARLRDGDHAKQVFDLALRTVQGRNPVEHDLAKDQTVRYHGGCYLNLLDAHPPFQIDGNFGVCAGVTEMLVQTAPDCSIQILPALPSEWKDGHVKGLKVRGGKTVDIEWHDGKATNVVIR